MMLPDTGELPSNAEAPNHFFTGLRQWMKVQSTMNTRCTYCRKVIHRWDPHFTARVAITSCSLDHCRELYKLILQRIENLE